MKIGDRVVYIQNNDPLRHFSYVGRTGIIVDIRGGTGYKYRVRWDGGYEYSICSALEIKPHNYYIYRLISKYYEV